MRNVSSDVGLLTLGDLIPDPVTGAMRTPAQRHRSFVEQAVLAEQVGMTRFHVGEHHFCEYILSSPAVVLGAIAERTTTLRLSTGVALGVNNEPLRLAEDYLTVDAISGGRAEPCIGRGTFFPHTFAAFGQDPTKARDQFAEHLEIIVRAIREESFSWSGEHHSPIHDLTVHPRPTQSPAPPIWVGAGSSAASVILTARLGCWLMLPTVFGTPEMFAPIVELYEQEWAAAGHDPADKRVGCVSHCYVHRSSVHARSAWEPRYRAYIEWVNALQARSSGGRNPGLGGFDFEALIASTAICGSPDEVVDRMGQLRETLHLDTHLLMLDLGGLPDIELNPAIELLGSDVLPKL